MDSWFRLGVTSDWTLSASFQHGDHIGFSVKKTFDSTVKPKKGNSKPNNTQEKNKNVSMPTWFEDLTRANFSSGVLIESARLNQEKLRLKLFSIGEFTIPGLMLLINLINSLLFFA